MTMSRLCCQAVRGLLCTRILYARSVLVQKTPPGICLQDGQLSIEVAYVKALNLSKLTLRVGTALRQMHADHQN